MYTGDHVPWLPLFIARLAELVADIFSLYKCNSEIIMTNVVVVLIFVSTTYMVSHNLQFK